MGYRVVVWGTGNVGRHAIGGVLDNPVLDLAGVWVSGAKAGRDAAELAGRPGPVGVTATSSVEEILSLAPECVVYTAKADDRLPEAVEDLRRLLAAGINVVSSGPVFLQFPYGVVPSELTDPLQEAGEQSGASLWVNGIDPGFTSDLLPLALSSASRRIDQVHCMVIWDYSAYQSATVLFDIMGFGQPLDHVPFLLQPGVLQLGWGSVVRQLAAGLEVDLDRLEESFERTATSTAFDIDSGHIPADSAAALRFQVVGIAAERPVIVLEHICRLREDLEPDWPQPAHPGGSYRVDITGDPNYSMQLCVSNDVTTNDAAMVGAAMRLVNAVPAVIAARPGLLTALDLPFITGTGLVAQAATAGAER